MMPQLWFCDCIGSKNKRVLKIVYFFLANMVKIGYNKLLTKLQEVHLWQNFILNMAPWAPAKRRRH